MGPNQKLIAKQGDPNSIQKGIGERLEN